MVDEAWEPLLADPDDVTALSLERAGSGPVCQRCGQDTPQTWTLTLGDEGDAALHAFDVCAPCAALFTRSLTYHQGGGV